MKKEVESKLEKIANIWNHYIWEYDFCKKEINFNSEVKSNYFGDILGYFQDTFDIVFDYTHNTNSHNERFSSQISLLQSIYVQQDFIEEMLRLFKIKINKGDLKKNLNYSINRDVRNELVGHPIRRENGNGALISSCLFGYNQGTNSITYLKYHRDKNFEYESMEYSVTEIIMRHKDFLIFYFDIILSKLKCILFKFVKKLEILENLADKKSFDEILKISEVFYESIFKSNYIYDKQSLLTIYSKKDENERYLNLINQFYKDLKIGLKETKEYIYEMFEPKKEIKIIKAKIPRVKIVNVSKEELGKIEKPITYHYELGKLATKRNPMDFNFFGECLKSKCLDNKLVLKELKHMESNIYDKIEYYSALKLIMKELNLK